MSTRETVRELEEALRKARAAAAEEERKQLLEVERGHVYPEKFPFVVDDVDEVTMGWFKYGPFDDTINDQAWDDYREARRRWEAYPKLLAEIERLKNVLRDEGVEID